MLLSRVKWRLKDIDWPTCMSHIEFVYYDTVYNESIFTHTYSGPFVDKMEIELLNTQVPCDEEYSHITRVLGLNLTSPGSPNLALFLSCSG